MTISRVVLCLSASFIGGIFLESIFFSQLFLLSFLILGIVFTLSGFWDKKFFILGLCLVFVVIGVWRYHLAEAEIKNSELQRYNDVGEIVLTGIIIEEPEVKEEKVKLKIKVQELNSGTEEISVSGKILVATDRYSKYNYGDNLKIYGKLRTPPVFKDFNYKGFLAKEGVVSVVYQPEIIKIGEGEGNIILANILSFKKKMRESINKYLSPPQSLILGAIILGDKGRISGDLQEKLNIAGVRHITAISGMHIAIIAVVLMQFLIGIGLWRGQAFYLTIVFLILFIVMIGLPSSAVRAGVMIGMMLLAQKIGRRTSSFRSVVFTASLLLLVNPLLLRFDVGFQLSFLAVAGIIFLTPFFQQVLRRIPETLFNLRSIISMSLAAQVFTLPILIYNFGEFSLVSPLVNVLILPLLPFLISLGLLTALVGIFVPFLGHFLSWFCWLFLTYVIKVINVFSSFSFSSIILKNIHWGWLAFSYLVLIFLVWQINERRKAEFLNY